jgi:hypothetical protein
MRLLFTAYQQAKFSDVFPYGSVYLSYFSTIKTDLSGGNSIRERVYS